MVQHVGEDDETGVDQVEDQPHLHWLDGGCRRQTSGNIKIDGGQHHHTGSGKRGVKIEHRTKLIFYMLMV